MYRRLLFALLFIMGFIMMATQPSLAEGANGTSCQPGEKSIIIGKDLEGANVSTGVIYYGQIKGSNIELCVMDDPWADMEDAYTPATPDKECLPGTTLKQVVDYNDLPEENAGRSVSPILSTYVFVSYVNVGGKLVLVDFWYCDGMPDMLKRPWWQTWARHVLPILVGIMIGKFVLD